MNEAKELHAQARKTFPTNRIIVLGIDDLWQADLLVLRDKSRHNNGYKYIFNVIDCFSKVVWSEPLKTKKGEEVTDAFIKIINKAKKMNHRAPHLLHTDKGLEFRNKDLKNVLDQNNIHMYHTESGKKASIVERFNRTLNNRLKIKFEIQRNYNWIDILDEIIYDYNYNTVHRTIGMKPIEVNKQNEQLLKETVFNFDEEINEKPKFKIGDRVRLVKTKSTFPNKYGANWSNEIYTITNINQTKPITYNIKDEKGNKVEGRIYKEEIRKTKF